MRQKQGTCALSDLTKPRRCFDGDPGAAAALEGEGGLFNADFWKVWFWIVYFFKVHLKCIFVKCFFRMLFEKVSLGAATFEGEGGVFNGDFSTFFSFGKEVFFGVAEVALTGVWWVFAVSTFCCFVSAESLLAFPFADSLESLLFENGSFLTCVSSSMMGLVVPGFCFWSFEFKSGVFAQLGRPASFMSFRES